MTANGSCGDRPLVLFVGVPQGLALSGVLECEHRGWDANFFEEVVEGLDGIDATQPDIVVVPLSPPLLGLHEFCAVAMRGTTARRRGIFAWPAAPASPVVGDLMSRWGVVACVPSGTGAVRLCDEIGRWLRACDDGQP